jgi:tRNA (guanine10-N2)-dimethyltransferase
MTQSVCILGRQPGLGMAELESLYGAENVHPIGQNAVLLDNTPADVDFRRLGGSIKLAKLLTILDTTEWGQIEKYLLASVVPHTQYLPEGKMNLGLSAYGIAVQPARMNATALSLKKVIKATGRPVRVVPNKTPDLSSAQVLHNDLTAERSWELLFIRDGNKTYLAQTTDVQNINAYAARDQKRPKRDARVGMLPPKLAQIIINLANPAAKSTVLDPFCGTGVVLQEALLMSYNTYGTDLEPRMVEYSDVNLQWLVEKFRVDSPSVKLAQGDATNYQWESFDTIACETYLGRPFSALPAIQILREVMSDVDKIHKKFLQNVARQTKPGFKMCIAVPAWKTDHGFTHLKTLDNLGELGYTRSVFTHVDSKDLIYHRPEQIVARELVILIRK